jgi:hypothetical protein
MQLTHCKQYSLKSLVASDVFCRAIPWTRLMLTNGIFRSDMNTKRHNVLSVIVAYLLLGLMPMVSILPVAGSSLFLALTVCYLWLNRKFLRFVFQERGAWFTVRSVALSWFGYLYSGFGLAIGVALFVRDWLSGTVPRLDRRELPIPSKQGRTL